MFDPTLRSRGSAVAILLVLTIVLAAGVSGSSHDREQGDGAVLQAIDHLVDSVLTAYHIDRSSGKKWSIRNGGGEVVRIERRIRVPRELVSILFNRDLGRSVRPLGAHVTGTERTKESLVVLHVVARRRTMHTISLEMSAKESS